MALWVASLFPASESYKYRVPMQKKISYKAKISFEKAALLYYSNVLLRFFHRW